VPRFPQLALLASSPMRRGKDCRGQRRGHHPGIRREAHSRHSRRGDYSAPELLPGHYEVTAAAPGFKRLAREATVDAGTTTTANLAMQVGLKIEIRK
jgi:hypothetical protein